MVSHTKHGERGFTLIEIMVVMAIIAVMMTLVAPNYLRQYQRSRENVLRWDLRIMRKSLDDYFSDHGRSVTSLADLVSQGYLQAVPVDPLTGRADWQLSVDEERQVLDVHSGAAGKAEDGRLYAEL
jgi:general secretion pathway protein G